MRNYKVVKSVLKTFSAILLFFAYLISIHPISNSHSPPPASRYLVVAAFLLLPRTVATEDKPLNFNFSITATQHDGGMTSICQAEKCRVLKVTNSLYGNHK